MYRHIKRVFDFSIASISLVVLSPLFLLLAIVIKMDSPGPVLFKQKRIMRGKETYIMLKFRTMRIDAPKDIPTHLLENPELFISKIGKILRKFSLDEIIQIVHILSGKMSLIGPRPALWNQYDLIAERDKYGANDVRPGLTGWAQINGRDELSISVKARLDGEYVQNISFRMDFRCFIKTIIKVIRKDNVVEGAECVETK